ncbi:MAG: hypothetical protein ACXABY_37690 [Candidatus Thorarchaeota archaeon]|jgi:hypothetical protein
MAISALTQWECRTDGDQDNGGGFVDGASGTDYSQQAAAEASYTDLVLDTTTTMSSVARSFVAADVGNLIHVTGGTGFTLGRYEIVSVAAGVATLDRVAGSASSTGGTAELGGAIDYPNQFNDDAVSGNTLWIRAGAYTISTLTGNVNNGVVNLTSQRNVIGYGTVRGDVYGYYHRNYGKYPIQH